MKIPVRSSAYSSCEAKNQKKPSAAARDKRLVGDKNILFVFQIISAAKNSRAVSHEESTPRNYKVSQ